MRTLLTSALCAALLSCGPGVAWAAPAPDAADMSKPATGHTRAAHAAMSKEVDFADRQDFQDAQRGFLAPLPDRGRILDANGRETWNLAPYDFLAPAMSRDFPPSVIMPTQAPDTVNPSLWRQSQLVLRDGLYKVVDRLYQIRNADLSNMTIIEGDSGIIVVDPLISAENAAAALKLYYAHRPHKPVVAVIYSHSHVDHYGGVHGAERVRTELGLMRDLYRYINDQTMHLANKGQTMLEIAETLRLPPELQRVFSLRGYYGSLNHNAKAVYNYYLGWFDGNPAHLHMLAPVEAARKYVEYMGGADAVLKRARKDFEAGQYRWVAQVLDHVIFAEPDNKAARELAADALEQLGYQAESAP